MKEEKTVEELKKEIEVLRSICKQINPYGPISSGIKQKLADYEITDWDDPFALTKKLLVLLDDSMEKLKEKKRIKKQ
ncbi:MAG: hypothetical protein OXB84_03340 [Halobacteriovoraceae bacterium]|nr:hypothetical protein [Halobacteriovoraceae bacterium]